MTDSIGVSLLYPLVDQLGVKLSYDPITKEVTGSALLKYPKSMFAVDLRVVYSYLSLNHPKVLGVIFHMAGDVYLYACVHATIVGLSLVDGSKLDILPVRGNVGYTSPTEDAKVIFDYLMPGIVKSWEVGIGGWLDVKNINEFKKRFFRLS